MLSFFRKIRRELIANSQFFKYLKYAAGEILLVVIGILIALQINEWNDYRVKRKLEAEFLKEIKENLLKDTAQIGEVLRFNLKKEDLIKKTMHRFEKAETDAFDLSAFGSDMSVLGTYDNFHPNRTAFDNLLDTESIGLISNKDLRTLISKYYKFDFEKGTQETVGYRTRSFTEKAAMQLTTQENINRMYGVNLDLKSSTNTRIYKDENIITGMVHMSIAMSYQNELLTNTLNEVNRILDLIEANTGEKE